MGTYIIIRNKLTFTVFGLSPSICTMVNSNKTTKNLTLLYYDHQKVTRTISTNGRSS